MAVCLFTGKKSVFGLKRSHSRRATPRKWQVNMQKVKIFGKVINVSTKALKMIKRDSTIL